MEELLNHLSIYYQCTAMAEAHELTQTQRFACNELYQQVKRLFIGAEKTQLLTQEENAQAYLRFKAWEADNPDVLQALKAR